jgi:hypothetical protein
MLEEIRTPVGRTDFKSDEGRQTSLVGSTPTLFRHDRPTGAGLRKAGSEMSEAEPKVVEVFSDYV